MSDFDEKLKDHLLKYHLRDLQHDAEIVKLTGQNESLFDDVERLRAALEEIVNSPFPGNNACRIARKALNPDD